MQGIYLYRPFGRDRYPETAPLRAAGYLATWLAAFPESKPMRERPRFRDDPHCDFEDWCENVVLLHEANARGIPVRILPPAPQIWVSTSGWQTPISVPGAPVGAMFGGWSTADYMSGLPVPISLAGQDTTAVDAASNYAESPVFLRHAGRRMIFVDATNEDLERALAEILGDRSETVVFLKSVRKEFSGIARITAGTTLHEQVFDQMDGLDLEIVHYEGDRRLLLVQDAVECGYEYRFFVVDGQLVTGAGCVEHHTPLDNVEAFDAKMEPVRNRSEVGAFPDMRDQHLAFAHAFVEEFAAEHGRHLDYCLDVAVDASGRTFVIELNPPLNCGRYASDVGLWIDAIVARTEAAIA